MTDIPTKELKIKIENIKSDKKVVKSLNPLTPDRFVLVVPELIYKSAKFDIQMVSIPDIMMSATEFSTPTRNLKFMSDKVEYSPLDLTYLVDEELQNYKEIKEWMLKYFERLSENTEFDMSSMTRDLHMQIYDSKNNLVDEIIFYEAIPITLSSLPFETTATDTMPLVANVTFEYSKYKFKSELPKTI